MGVIPLSDASRRPIRMPVVTASIIAVNVAVFLLELIGGDAFVTKWSLVPADIVAGQHLLTILTSMFMHGSVSHILGNMVFFWAFGPELEDLMGGRKYLVYYLLGGLAATAAQVAADPTSTVPNLGASGAIAAVMGGFIVTYPRDRIRSLLVIFIFVRMAYIPAALLIGVWFLTQLVNLGAVVQHPQPGGGVAYAAHVGGFIFGAVTARLFERQPALTEARSG
jgi:membrane associated rhomboid family serine protease